MHYSPDGFEAVYTDEGRVTPIYNDSLGTLDSFQYEWVIRDHLGNGRVYFSDLDKNLGISSQMPQEVLQERHYYPFGLMFEGPFLAQVGPQNEYTYNGKRYHREGDLNWYDYGFRFYDATIARFPSLDPIADEFEYVTPYNYAENNPASGIDLYGLQFVEQRVAWELFKTTDTYEALSADQYDYEAAQEQYDEENSFVPGLGNVEANAGNQNTTEGLGGFAELSPDILMMALGTGNAKATMGGVGVAKTTGKAAAGEEITVFRGVNESHTGFGNALKGKATPRGGKATPAEHNAGNTKSEFTSWTKNREVAKNYALRPSGSGVILDKKVLRSDMVQSPSRKNVLLKQSKKIVNESEVLLKGPVRGANVTKIQ